MTLYRKFKKGDSYTNNHGTEAIIEDPYFDKKKCRLRVKGTDILFICDRQVVKKGEFKTPLCKTIYGVGYLGQGPYKSRTSEGVMIESYKYWANMLRRCYTSYDSDKSVESYKNCFVEDTWHNYQNFATWFWDNYKESRVKLYLDKDILSNGNGILYSEEICCLIPNIINTAISVGRKTSSKHGVGVLKEKDDYLAYITKKGKAFRLGSYKTKEEAHSAFLREKEKYIQSLAEEYKDVLRKDVYEKLLGWKYAET